MISVLHDPELAGLFGPGSRAEVPLTGIVGGRALTGRIDRLIVKPGEVIIADYKTNRPPPEGCHIGRPGLYPTNGGLSGGDAHALYPDHSGKMCADLDPWSPRHADTGSTIGSHLTLTRR